MTDKPSTLVLERAEWVFKEGDPGDSLFLIKSGMVQIVKEINGNDVTLATLSDNEVFGEMALFSDLPRSASAQALVSVTLTNIPKSFIRGKFDTSDPLFQLGVTSLFQFLRQLNLLKLPGYFNIATFGQELF